MPLAQQTDLEKAGNFFRPKNIAFSQKPPFHANLAIFAIWQKKPGKRPKRQEKLRKVRKNSDFLRLFGEFKPAKERTNGLYACPGQAQFHRIYPTFL
jgi:hypothetical protein